MRAEREKLNAKITAGALKLAGGRLELPAEMCHIVLFSGGSCTVQCGDTSLLVSPGCALLLGLLELRRMGPSVYEWYVVAGLTLGMLGDLLLALRFLSEKLHRLFFAAGSMSFFLGHIVYILAILTLCPAAWLYAIPIAVVALGAACFYAYAKEVRAGRITPLGVVYIGGVLFMTACAATGAFIESSRALFLFFVGGICFSASDNMLVVLSFGKNDSPYRNAVLHVLYYMAQIFIALTIQFA